MNGRSRSTLAWWSWLGLIVVLGTSSSFVVWDGIVSEDAYITYRYAQNLAAGNGFVFNPKEHVLGTTTPLTAMLLALAGAIGVQITTAGSVVFCSALAAIAVLGASLLRSVGLASAGLLFAALVVSNFGSVIGYWGMETPLLGAFLFGALLAFVKSHERLAGLLVGLAIVTRYDAALFALALLGTVVLTGVLRRRARGEHRLERREDAPIGPSRLERAREALPLRAISIAGLIVVPWCVFALIYFGDILPNTLAAKHSALDVSEYLYESVSTQARRALASWPRPPLALPSAATTGLLLMLVAAMLAGGRRLCRSQPAFLAALVYSIVLWLAYAVIAPPVGHGWHLVPALWFLLLLALGAIEITLTDPARGAATDRAVRITLLAIALGVAVRHPFATQAAKDAQPNERNRARVVAYREMASFLVAHDLTDLTVLTYEPGYLAFLSGNPVIDAAGLVTRDVRYHGPVSERPGLRALVKRFEPELIVPLISGTRIVVDGYVPVMWAFNRRVLLMRRARVRERYDRLTHDVPPSRLPAAPLASSDLLATDMEAGTARRWREAGGWLRPVDELGKRRGQELGASSVAIIPSLGGPPNGRGGAESPSVEIDFDELQIRFAATLPTHNAPQFLVDGRLVLEARDRGSERAMSLREVSWPVTTWRGRSGRVRFPNIAPIGEDVVVDWVRPIAWRTRALLDDFERPQLGDSWHGFGGVTTDSIELVALAGPGVFTGAHAATSFGIAGAARLESAPFRVAHRGISLLLFDFCEARCQLSLITTDDQVTQRRVSGQREEQLRGVVWEVPELIGRDVRIELHDGDPSPDAFFGIDEVWLFDRNEG